MAFRQRLFLSLFPFFPPQWKLNVREMDVVLTQFANKYPKAQSEKYEIIWFSVAGVGGEFLFCLASCSEVPHHLGMRIEMFDCKRLFLVRWLIGMFDKVLAKRNCWLFRRKNKKLFHVYFLKQIFYCPCFIIIYCRTPHTHLCGGRVTGSFGSGLSRQSEVETKQQF